MGGGAGAGEQGSRVLEKENSPKAGRFLPKFKIAFGKKGERKRKCALQKPF